VGKADAAALGAFVRLGGFDGFLSSNGLNTLKNKIKDFDNATRSRFINDFDNNLSLLQALNHQPDLVDVWIILEVRPILRKQLEALQSVARIKRNPKFLELGLTDDILSRIKSHKNTLGDEGYAEVINDLNSLGNMLHNNPAMRLDNFAGRISILTGNNMNLRQGTHGVIKEIIENADLYRNKVLRFEQSVPNARGNNSFIDIYTNDIPPLMVERKWYAVGSLDKTTFIEEFIERDLFHATKLRQIRWSFLGNKPTKTQIVDMLASPEGRDALLFFKNSNTNKFQTFFGNSASSFGTGNVVFDKEVISRFVDNNFDLIFK
jgi:hypothetical protein